VDLDLKDTPFGACCFSLHEGLSRSIPPFRTCLPSPWLQDAWRGLRRYLLPYLFSCLLLTVSVQRYAFIRRLALRCHSVCCRRTSPPHATTTFLRVVWPYARLYAPTTRRLCSVRDPWTVISVCLAGALLPHTCVSLTPYRLQHLCGWTFCISVAFLVDCALSLFLWTTCWTAFAKHS